MDWYSGSDIEDVAGPKDEEIFDGIPSPDSWSSWGNMVGNFNSPKKLNVLGEEELLLSEIMFSSAVDQLCPSSICQCSRHTFCQHCACPHENSDELLDDLPIIDDADDIFFNSLFEVDGRESEEADGSATCTQTSSNDDVMAAVDLLGGRNDIQERTDNFESHCLPKKEPASEIFLLEEQSNDCEDISEEYISMDESVLLELQRLSGQLAKKTRICFRDSLYRLAENSRYQTKCSQNGEDDLKNCGATARDGPSRLRGSKANESDTNAIDRTVATLLFDTMKFCTASTTGLIEETLQREYEANSHLYDPSFSISPLCSIPGGDAEVPTFVSTDQPLPPPKKGCTPFSSTPVMWF